MQRPLTLPARMAEYLAESARRIRSVRVAVSAVRAMRVQLTVTLISAQPSSDVRATETVIRTAKTDGPPHPTSARARERTSPSAAANAAVTAVGMTVPVIDTDTDTEFEDCVLLEVP